MYSLRHRNIPKSGHIGRHLYKTGLPMSLEKFIFSLFELLRHAKLTGCNAPAQCSRRARNRRTLTRSGSRWHVLRQKEVSRILYGSSQNYYFAISAKFSLSISLQTKYFRYYYRLHSACMRVEVKQRHSQAGLHLTQILTALGRAGIKSAVWEL